MRAGFALQKTQSEKKTSPRWGEVLSFVYLINAMRDWFFYAVPN
jgi:hypothetical protein